MLLIIEPGCLAGRVAMLFDLGMSELMLIGVVALVFIGPKDLPKALRVAGFWVRKARTLSREFQSSVEQMIREAELDEMRQELKKATEIDLEKEFQKTIDPTGEPCREPEAAGAAEISPTPTCRPRRRRSAAATGRGGEPPKPETDGTGSARRLRRRIDRTVEAAAPLRPREIPHGLPASRDGDAANPGLMRPL